ncbi:MAG: hypothetical protein ACI9P7_002140, partial [Candidatus Azotimanducaceae bacterium]
MFHFDKNESPKSDSIPIEERTMRDVVVVDS